MAIASHKVCTVCGLDKPQSDFSPDRRATTGLQPRCKPCVNAARKAARDADIETTRAKQREYVAANKGRVYQRNNEYRERHADRVRAIKKRAYERDKHDPDYIARRDAYAAATKDQKREYDKEYRARDPEANRLRAEAWRKANPDKRAAIIHSYSARRRAQSKGGVSTKALAAWTASQKKVCYWCGAKCPSGFHIDHYTPLAKGGRHELSNLVIACAPCNLRKNAKDPFAFAQEVGRLF